MPKQRTHNEHFRPVSLGGRVTCPACKVRLSPGESLWSWGEYVNAKWRTVMHFCPKCFPTQVLGPLTDHVKGCGCKVELVVHHHVTPDWLTLCPKH